MDTLIKLYRKMFQESDPEQMILTVVDSRLNPSFLSLRMLDESISRTAGFLKSVGCEKGDRVLISLRETVPLWSVFWGALQLGAVPCVLFPGLGAGGLEVRLKGADTCFFVTDENPSKILRQVRFPASLKKIILTGKNQSGAIQSSSESDLDPVPAVQWDGNEQIWVDTETPLSPDDNAFIVFTSGTTGTPKPVVHRHGIAGAIFRSMTDVLHASREDTFWCTAHPAWITGTVYGILGPLLCGIPSIQYEGSFHAKRWMPILQERKVSLWYTAPTALRALMQQPPDFFKVYDFSSLKQIYSIGEPLSESVFFWAEKTFAQPVYDTWFQTECGTVRIAAQPGEKLRPGWMGRPVDDTEVTVTESGALRLKAGFSSMFKEYYGMPEETDEKISGGLFRTGDLVTADPDGFIKYRSREDDVINTSGHLVSPLEIEQVLTANPAVAAAAVTAEPDELLYEAPAAYIVLADGQAWSRQLESALKVAVNTGVSPYAVPKHFYTVSDLPYTASGKINRAALRKSENGALD